MSQKSEKRADGKVEGLEGQMGNCAASLLRCAMQRFHSLERLDVNDVVSVYDRLSTHTALFSAGCSRLRTVILCLADFTQHHKMLQPSCKHGVKAYSHTGTNNGATTTLTSAKLKRGEEALECQCHLLATQQQRRVNENQTVLPMS